MGHNLTLVQQVTDLAARKGCTPTQLALAWVRKHSGRPGLPTVIPLPGSTTVERVTENSRTVEISEDEFTAINKIVRGFEVAGARYPAGVPMNT